MGSEFKTGSRATDDLPGGDYARDYGEPRPSSLIPVEPPRPLPPEPESGYEGSLSRTQPRGITARQAVFLIVVNAWISLLIALSVVLAVEWWRNRSGAAAVGPAQATATPAGPVVATSPSPTASGETIVYVVESGDTLFGIAEKFGVLASDIMRANGLTDPNLLYAGQELIIPLGGLPAETPALPTSTPPAVVDTPTSGPLASPVATGQLQIVDIVGRGDLDAEMVVILNTERPVRLKGWTLSDAQGHIFTFPDLFLGAEGSVRVHTAEGQNSVTDLYWGQSAAMWAEPGDVATLRDANGAVVHTYQLP